MKSHEKEMKSSLAILFVRGSTIIEKFCNSLSFVSKPLKNSLLFSVENVFKRVNKDNEIVVDFQYALFE
jgi:hypothetical protein